MTDGAVRRVAAVDCGTNSIRLLVADVDVAVPATDTAPDGPAAPAVGALHDVVRRMEVVRLGEGVDRTGRISEAAMERALGRSREYAEQCADLSVSAVRFVATSAARDAGNAEDFAAGVRAAFAEHGHDGVVPEVITGDEEAELSFLGATGDLAAAGIPGPYLVVDLGGGSTELVRGTAEGAVEAARSVDMGCVRHAERYLHHDPPTADELAAALAEVDRQLDLACSTVELAGVRTLVGVAGTVTTVTAHAMGLAAYDPEVIHLSRLPADVVRAACADLVHLDRPSRAALPFMHPGRVDVIGPGALIWGRIVERVVGAGADDLVVSSEHDILDGVCLRLAGSVD